MELEGAEQKGKKSAIILIAGISGTVFSGIFELVKLLYFH